MSDYWTLPGLQDVYLEDSWVRRITVEPNLLRVGDCCTCGWP